MKATAVANRNEGTADMKSESYSYMSEGSYNTEGYAGLHANTGQGQDEKILTFSPAASEPASSVVNVASMSGAAKSLAKSAPRDLSGSFQLVEEAAEAMRINQDRIAGLEAQIAQLEAKASEDARRLTIKLEEKDLELQRAQMRIRDTELRAEEAEAWLVRLNETIKKSFGPLLQANKSHVAALPISGRN